MQSLPMRRRSNWVIKKPDDSKHPASTFAFLMSVTSSHADAGRHRCIRPIALSGVLAKLLDMHALYHDW